MGFLQHGTSHVDIGHRLCRQTDINIHCQMSDVRCQMFLFLHHITSSLLSLSPPQLKPWPTVGHKSSSINLCLYFLKAAERLFHALDTRFPLGVFKCPGEAFNPRF